MKKYKVKAIKELRELYEVLIHPCERETKEREALREKILKKILELIEKNLEA